MTLGLWLLRCTQLGLSVSDLELLDAGMVWDMMIENANDSAADDPDAAGTADTVRSATQADFDNF